MPLNSRIIEQNLFIFEQKDEFLDSFSYSDGENQFIENAAYEEQLFHQDEQKKYNNIELKNIKQQISHKISKQLNTNNNFKQAQFAYISPIPNLNEIPSKTIQDTRQNIINYLKDIKSGSRDVQSQLVSKLNSLIKIKEYQPKSSEYQIKASSHIQFREPNERDMCKILIVMKKILPDCSLNKVIENLYRLLVKKQTPTEVFANIQEQKRGKSIRSNSSNSSAIIALKYQTIIQFFNAIGYGYEKNKQHFIQKRLNIQSQQYKFIILDIMDKTFRRIIQFVQKDSSRIGYNLQFFMNNLELVKKKLSKAHDWMLRRQKQIFHHFMSALYKIRSPSLKSNINIINIDEVIKLLQSLQKQVKQMGEYQIYDQLTKSKIKSEVKAQFQSTQVNKPEQSDFPLFKQQKAANHSAKTSGKININLALQTQTLTQNLTLFLNQQPVIQSLLQNYLKSKNPQTIKQNFIYQYPKYESTITMDILRAKIQKVLRDSYEQFSLKYNENYKQLMNTAQYKEFFMQNPPLKKLPQQKIKWLIKNNKGIQIRHLLVEFYFNKGKLKTQFELVKKIKAVLNLSEKKGRKQADKKNIIQQSEQQDWGLIQSVDFNALHNHDNFI